jgi:type 1 glutamine amidotransferase
MTRVLLLHGGWDGHDPDGVADFAVANLLDGCEVVRSKDLSLLRPSDLQRFDLLVIAWTFGEITTEQETALIAAVAGGMGLVTWHGGASAFLASRQHKLLIGGQFVGHPGGSTVTYDVQFHENDVLVDSLEQFAITTEQYYMLVDPAVKVVASTRMKLPLMPWLDDVEMPVAWMREWGRGRVFYCSIGHTVEQLAHPTVTELLRRAIRWASRRDQ